MKNDYNSLASYYNSIVTFVFGTSLKEAQLGQLNHLPKQGTILFIGGGDGMVLKEVILLRPDLKIDYIDQSEKMIQLSKKRVKNLKHQIQFITGNEENIPPTSYDAILTFFFLDLFQEKRQKFVTEKLALQLNDMGLWLITDFNVPKKKIHRIIEWLMFTFLKWVTQIEANSISDYRSLLHGYNFKELSHLSFYKDFVFSSVFQNKDGTVLE